MELSHFLVRLLRLNQGLRENSEVPESLGSQSPWSPLHPSRLGDVRGWASSDTEQMSSGDTESIPDTGVPGGTWS